MDVCAVIAKYTEDVSWTSQLHCPFIVYDKSKDVPNIGREADTYLQFIIANYDSLPEHSVFLQGNPFDHLETPTIDFINRRIRMRRTKTMFLNSLYVEKPNLHGLSSRDAWLALFDQPCPNNFVFSTGAQYIVPRSAILCRPKAFYQTISRVMTDYHSYGQGGCLVCPWTIERLWPYIFETSIRTRNIKYEDLLVKT